MEIIIISSSSSEQTAYWEKRLEEQKGRLIPLNSLILCIDEDWPGGAGNGLGTLYAYQKACKKAQQHFEVDIIKEQKQGASVALYHTAGHGKRLAPLTLCEYNNKPAVKLPSSTTPMLSILEGVIKQTLVYAPLLKGRLSVFWGDQLFFPSELISFTINHHIALFAMKHPFPTSREWEKKKWSSYGVVALDLINSGYHIEKCDFETLSRYAQQGLITVNEGLAISLGSFSLSLEMTLALLNEFSPELEKRQVRMDCETSMWMPLTLPKNIYTECMQKIGVSLEEINRQYTRMQNFKQAFPRSLFGIIDMGLDGYWWDYGTLQHYFENNLKATHASVEGNTMRTFLGFPSPQTLNSSVLSTENSLIFDSKILSGSIKNSIVIGVNADHLEISDCILIQTKVSKFQGQSCLLYKVTENAHFSGANGYVRADLLLPGNTIKMMTNLERDGKADWNLRLPGNHYSYEELYQMIISHE